MTAITITDLDNAKTDVDHIATFATSAALTATDRLGHTKKTIAGLSAEILNAGVYATIADGLAATSNGQYFSAVSADSADYLILYLNSAGSALKQKRYPSSEALTDLLNDEIVNPVDPSVVAAIYDLTTGRYAPFMHASGRLLQTDENGDFEKVALGESSMPIYGLIGGERPYKINADAQGKIFEAWTIEGSYFIAGSSGLIKVGQNTTPPNYQTSANITLYGGTTWVGVPADPALCYILPTLGQSGAYGQNDTNDAVVAGVSQYPSNCFMFSGGSPRRDVAGIRTIVPAVEADTGSASETAATSWATHLVRDVAAAIGRNIRTLSFVAAQGGVPYYKLKRGTPAYTIFLQSMTDAVAVCKDNGWVPIVPAVDWMQGESDTNQVPGMTQRWYERELQQLARHLSEDIKAITNQVTDPIVFATQIAFAPGTEYWSQPVRAAALALDGRENIRCPGPYYPLPTAGVGLDNIHANCTGQNRRGQMLARATLTECFGTGWRAMGPTGYRWVSTTVLDIDIECQLAPLVLDTSGTVITVTGLSNYGFLFDDRSGSAPAISSVAIVNNTTVRITLASAPTGLGGRIAYATKSTTTDLYGPVSGARGCLRDSAPSVNAYNASTHYNWCNSFVLEVNHP